MKVFITKMSPAVDRGIFIDKIKHMCYNNINEIV